MRATQLLLGVDSAVAVSAPPPKSDAARIREQTEERQVLGRSQGDSAKAGSHPETSPKDTCLLPNNWARGPSWEEKERRRGAAERRAKQAQAKNSAAEPPAIEYAGLSLSSGLSSS